MYKQVCNDNIVPIEELVCFSSLLLRWSYDTPRKLFYKVSCSYFYLYELKDVYKNDNDSILAQIDKHIDNGDKFDYLINNYEYLFFLKKEIAIAEDKDLMLALIPAHINASSNKLICTKENIGVVAAKSINAICVQDCHNNVDREELDTFRIDGVLQFGTRNRPIPPDRVWPKIPYLPHNNQMRINKTELHKEAEAFISLLRSLGQGDKYVLARQVKLRYPQLTQPAIGRLLSPHPGKSENLHTLRQRGRRLLGLVP